MSDPDRFAVKLRTDAYIELRDETKSTDIVHRIPKEKAEEMVEELQAAIDEWEAKFG